MVRIRGFAGACLAAIGAGATVAALIPSQASGVALPSLQVFAVAASPGGAGPSTAISAAADASGELFALTDANGHDTMWKSTSDGTFTEVQDAGPSASFETGMVVDAGSEWLVGQGVNNGVANPGTLYQLDSSGAVRSSALLGKGGSVPQDMVVGPDGNLYVSDSAGSVWQAAPVQGTQAFNFAAPGAPAFRAIGSAGGRLWLTDSSGNLRSMTTTASFAGPYLGGQLSPYPHTLAGGNDGDLYAIGEAANDGTTILQINPATATVSQTFAAPAGSNIVALTSGPDGNIWFADDYKNTVGYLNPASGQIQELPLPQGYVIPQRGFASIQPGPNGTLWFSVQSVGGGAAVGEIGNLPQIVTTDTVTVTNTVTTTIATTPTSTVSAAVTPDSLRLAATAQVKHGSAQLKATCVGSARAGCAGKLVITVIQAKPVTGSKRRKGKRVTVKLASMSYSLGAGRSATWKVKLSKPGRTALAKAGKHRLPTKATVSPRAGPGRTFNVTLVQATAKRKQRR